MAIFWWFFLKKVSTMSLRIENLNYLCNAFGIHPILCVWGLTFKKEAIEPPSFRLYPLVIIDKKNARHMACIFFIDAEANLF